MPRARAALPSWVASVLLPLPCRPERPTSHGRLRTRAHRRGNSASRIDATVAGAWRDCVLASRAMTNPNANSESAALYQEAIATFRDLLAQAQAGGDREPTAMTLATLGEGERVSARIVLLKGIDERGFRFFTNYDSMKGTQLAARPQAALCFHWKLLGGGVQVRVEGAVERLSAHESDAYFATRARGSQLGAWASRQSQPLADRSEFEARIAEVERRFADGPVPRPPQWGGFVVEPDRIEFWYGADFRLHERQLYLREAGAWRRRMLYP